MASKRIRRFNSEWSDKFFFREVNGKPTCLICCKQLAENKSSTVERHYRTAHLDYNSRFPHGTERRREQLKKLQSQADEQRSMFRGGMTPVQERTTIVSYEIASRLASAMAPMQHGELFKDCLMQSIKTVFPEKTEILSTVEKVPLSRNTCTRGG